MIQIEAESRQKLSDIFAKAKEEFLKYENEKREKERQQEVILNSLEKEFRDRIPEKLKGVFEEMFNFGGDSERIFVKDKLSVKGLFSEMLKDKSVSRDQQLRRSFIEQSESGFDSVEGFVSELVVFTNSTEFLSLRCINVNEEHIFFRILFVDL